MGGLLSALTSIGDVGAQAGSAVNDVRAERQARADKMREFDIRDAQLQLERQAGERAERALQQHLKAGKYVDLGLPTSMENGVRFKTFWDAEQGRFSRVPIGRSAADPLGGLKQVISKFPQEQQDLIKANYESTLQATGGDADKALEKADALVTKFAETNQTQAAEEERRKKTQLAIDERARLAREAAAGRQRNAFRERERLNSKVMTDHEAAVDADNRVTRMIADIQDADNAENDPKKYPDGAGAFDMDLLSQHVALTFGAIKGGMRSKAMIDEHRNAVALLERAQRAYQSGARGSQLSPGQRRNFLKLARIAQQAAWDKYNVIKSDVQSGAVAPPQDQQFDLQPEPEQQ